MCLELQGGNESVVIRRPPHHSIKVAHPQNRCILGIVYSVVRSLIQANARRAVSGLNSPANVNVAANDA